MKVKLLSALSDTNIDASQVSSQRQLGISISAIAGELDRTVPLNLCFILDRSGSMTGKPLKMVKQAVEKLLDELKPGDRISVVAFDNEGQVIIPNQIITESNHHIKSQIGKLQPGGGTLMSVGLQLGMAELSKGKDGTISQAFLLTDGQTQTSSRIWKWEIGKDDNKECLKWAEQAKDENLTINTLGFGDDWNQDLLENIADVSGGTMSYIQQPEQAVNEFGRLFNRIQSVELTNAYLLLSLKPKVRLAELKPIAQIAPEVIELPVEQEGNYFVVRVGDLMKDIQKVILVNLYIGQLPKGRQPIASWQVRYDDPGLGQQNLLSRTVTVEANIVQPYQSAPQSEVQQYILALAKYRQTQMAETKLLQGDRVLAATLLQTAAKTALQMGDKEGATVLQTSATRLQAGEDLSEADRKKTRIVSKTVLHQQQ